ncbi:gliding motility-associated C-terminal domain-containing protein [Chitinophaga costaii]|uniref:Gliding motility-associated C-terminal domain-containing protein n=1 Tax=Chitinophaga costaii TaxID=1335309 RepID=A0A1C4CJK2_9BACT|nr:PKD domain-containing protein [Chitinophaga costaii]PUZ27062.1 PKD domain-containing protein [Chitinophaga costaii]SCC19330.1 gliding motility-associated C-terminal domain-containing protein [Chitinophaga costaii]
MKRTLCLLFHVLCVFLWAHGQTQQPYILNGNATQRSCNCYQLTPATTFASGTVWNKNKIDLSQSFNYVFDVNLGCDTNGADGIAFILQTEGTNLGANGQGIGFEGISPSLGVLIDTYQNTSENDPAYDHLAIQMNGLTNHQGTGNLAGPVQVLDGVNNIKDCQWHLLRIHWDATTHTLEISVDNQVRLSIQKDLVHDIFNDAPSVFWGFAGSTGGRTNVQQFCAALRPAFDFDASQILCDGTPVTFENSSSSFGEITRWYWDLGDGTIYNGAQPPAHLYPGAGIYSVKFVIQDNSGCISDTLTTSVTIGSYPKANFTPDTLCLDATPLQLSDASTVAVGTLNNWQWDFGNGNTYSGSSVTIPFTTTGNYPVTLTATTKEGCNNTISKVLRIAPSPSVGGTSSNVCLGDASIFKGENLTPAISIRTWTWDMNNGSTSDGQNTRYTYSQAGDYNVVLHATSDEGCEALSSAIPITVLAVKADAGKDTIVAIGQPLQLFSHATNIATAQYTWSPATGLNDPNSASPVAILNADQTYQLTVSSPEGCQDEDFINIKVYKGPEFYVPNAFSPNGDGKNDYFKAIAAGIPKIDFFRIWNRWGELVFFTSDLTVPWDGTIKGKPADIATYVWMIQGVDYTGRRFSRQGTVTLVR